MTKTRIGLLGVVGVIPIALALWVAGFDVAYQLGNYVISDNAMVAGPLVHASSPGSGQVVELLVEVGDSVQRNQPLATIGAGAAGLGQGVSSSRTTTVIRAPEEGTVVRVPVARGQTVTAGQTVAVLTNLKGLWIVANVDETSFRSVQPGQKVEVYLPALDKSLEGRVEDVLPAAAGISASTLTEIRPPDAGTMKGSPQIPVRIGFDYGEAQVLPGMTATVRIFIKS